MSPERSQAEVSVEKLRWRLDPAALSFETTQDLKPLQTIIGQNRGVEAFRFGMNMDKPGYNVFVTGAAGSGRMTTVKKLLEEMARKDQTPDDLCYVNCFRNPETPVLLRLKGGSGGAFKKDVKSFVETLKKEIPQLFESQEYISTKKEIMETYERRGSGFFKALDQKVKDEGFTLVDVQMGQYKRPEVMPLVDGNPVHIDQLEAMVEKGRFPKDEFETLKEKHGRLREQIDQIFRELKELQKEVHEKIEKMDRAAFLKTASDLAAPLTDKYGSDAVKKFLEEMIEDMAGNLKIFVSQTQAQLPGLMPFMPEANCFNPTRSTSWWTTANRKALR